MHAYSAYRKRETERERERERERGREGEERARRYSVKRAWGSPFAAADHVDSFWRGLPLPFLFLALRFSRRSLAKTGAKTASDDGSDDDDDDDVDRGWLV